MTLQGLPQRNLHQLILWKVTPSRMLVLQDKEWLQIWGKSVRMHIVRLMKNLVKGPKRMMTRVQCQVDEKWLTWKCIALCYQPWVETRIYWTSIIERTTIGMCLSRHEAAEVYSSEEHEHAENQSNVWNSRKLLHVTTKIRDQNPSLGYICPGEPHQRSPNAPKFEDRFQEETEWQEQEVPRRQRWSWPKCIKFKEVRKSNILLTFGKLVFTCINS